MIWEDKGGCGLGVGNTANVQKEESWLKKWKLRVEGDKMAYGNELGRK